jgi:hypothetical protein
VPLTGGEPAALVAPFSKCRDQGGISISEMCFQTDQKNLMKVSVWIIRYLCRTVVRKQNVSYCLHMNSSSILSGGGFARTVNVSRYAESGDG